METDRGRALRPVWVLYRETRQASESPLLHVNPSQYLALAASYAVLDDARHYWLGAVGLRADGALVRARNGPSKQIEPAAHAETRLIRKLDFGATVFVARISRATGQWALAKPCTPCKFKLLAKGVKRIYYTIGPNEYGSIHI